MKIAVIGGTRGIGLALVQAALAGCHDVTVLARTPSRMPIANLRLRIVAGDAQDPDAIAKAIEGQHVVCDCLGTANVVKKISMFSRCAENLSKALKPEQLLITVTGIGTGDSRGHGGWLYDTCSCRLFCAGCMRTKIARNTSSGTMWLAGSSCGPAS